MTRLAWDQTRDYEIGVDRGVFYPPTGPGEVWNGLISVNETPSESENAPFYIEGQKRNRKKPRGEFSGNIESFSYPPSFYSDILTQRRAKPFGLSYRTMTSQHYKLHLVYNVLLAPSGFMYQQSAVESYSWPFVSLPVTVPTAAKSAHIIIETDTAYSWTLEALEDVLYGSDEGDARLPTPTEVFQIFEDNSILQIIDNGDGSWTAIGPDDVVQMLDLTTFQISWPSAVYIDADSYTIHSL